MPDPTPIPTPTPEPNHPHKRGDIDQGWLNEFTNAESILAAAKPADRATLLAEGGINAAKISALTLAIPAARKLAGQAVQGTSGKVMITGDEEISKQELLQKIQYVQKRARQKYEADEPGRLKVYGIGQ